MQIDAKPKSRRFKLRSILLMVSVVVLILPVAGIYFLRIYENELVKQTELELISQAALISAVYRREIKHFDNKRTAPELRSKNNSRSRVGGLLQAH